MAPRGRFNNEGPDGTPFQELVVFPTLAPQLARPDNRWAREIEERRRVDGGGTQPLGQHHPNVDAGNGEDSAPVSGGPQHPDSLEKENTPPPAKMYFVSVTKYFMEPAVSARSKPKKTSATANVLDVPITELSRVKFIQEHMLAAHLLHPYYRASDINGPPFKLWWRGSPGSKTHAPTVSNDRDWSTNVALLKTQRNVDTICVSFDMEQMEPYRMQVIDPSLRGWQADMPFGTNVPRADSFSREAQVNGDQIMEIRERWWCDRDNDVCFQRGGQCYAVNRFKQKLWGASNAAGHTSVEEPPADLFKDDDVRIVKNVKPRGRGGPHPAATATSEGGSDTVSILNAILPHLAGEGFSTLRPKKRTREPESSPASAAAPSSPPPVPDDDLEICLRAFGMARALTDDVISTMLDNLAELDFTADTITDISDARLMDITKLSEGLAIGLKKFARGWTGRIEKKRAKVEKAERVAKVASGAQATN